MHPLAVQEGLEQLLLPLEVEVDRTTTDPRLVRDVGHRGLVVAQTNDDGGRRPENLLLAFVAIWHRPPPADARLNAVHNF